MPPKGIITHILLSTLITGIFGIITLRTCVSLTKQKLVAEIRAIRWTDRLIRSEDSHLPTNDALPIPHLSWNDGMRNNIESMVSILQKSLNLGFHFVRSLALSLNISLCQKIFLSASGELTSGRRKGTNMHLHLCFLIDTIDMNSLVQLSAMLEFTGEQDAQVIFLKIIVL